MSPVWHLFERGAYLRAALIKRLIPQSQNILIVQTNADNLLTATVTGKREREVGLVVPVKFKVAEYSFLVYRC